jgi:hypothetical protein
MWKWYLEWSAISRAAIKDGNLLRRLGFQFWLGKEFLTSEPLRVEDCRIEGAKKADRNSCYFREFTHCARQLTYASRERNEATCDTNRSA